MVDSLKILQINSLDSIDFLDQKVTLDNDKIEEFMNDLYNRKISI